MLFINGEWRNAVSGDTFESRNPANGDVIGTAADGGVEDVEAAVDAAADAFGSWSTRTAYERSAYLYQAHQLMLERREALAKLMTEEQGKPIRMARNEVGYAADFLLWFAEEAKRVYGETIPSARADQRFIVLRQPVGVVAAITPWNYPVSMLTRKIAPALAAGCTIVLKPAEQTPLLAIETFKIFEEIGIPEGVVNLITTSSPETVGPELVLHPKVRKITFTGSTEVGKLIAQQAATQVKRVSMELGGHAPFVVFDDADPVHAAKGAAAVKFLNTGQACISPNRMLVQRGIADEFLATLEQRFGALKAGSGFTDGVTVGPLIDDAAMSKMERQVSDALDKGATARDRWCPPDRRRPRRRVLLRADPAGGRDSRHGDLPRGDVRPHRAGHRVRHRRRSDRDGERHRVRPGVLRVHAVVDAGVPSHGAAEVRDGRDQRHQPDVGRGAVRRREAERPRLRRLPRRHRRVPRHQARRPVDLIATS